MSHVQDQDQDYRPCVGICLINNKQEIFVGDRNDINGDAWQMPQGGIDENEEIIEAFKRELREETSITSIEVLSITKNWITYDFPENSDSIRPRVKFKGQKQKWILAKFCGSEDEINLETKEPEFRAWQWMPAKDVIKIIVPFKKKLYLKVLKEFNLV